MPEATTISLSELDVNKEHQMYEEMMHQMTDGDLTAGMALQNSWYRVRGCIIGLMKAAVQRIGGTTLKDPKKYT